MSSSAARPPPSFKRRKSLGSGGRCSPVCLSVCLSTLLSGALWFTFFFFFVALCLRDCLSGPRGKTLTKKTKAKWSSRTGSSLAVQWLGLCAFTELRPRVQSLVRELKSRKPQGRQKKKKTREKRRKGEKGVLGENKIPFSPKEMVKSISNRQHTLCEDVCVR